MLIYSTVHWCSVSVIVGDVKCSSSVNNTLAVVDVANKSGQIWLLSSTNHSQMFSRLQTLNWERAKNMPGFQNRAVLMM